MDFNTLVDQLSSVYDGIEELDSKLSIGGNTVAFHKKALLEKHSAPYATLIDDLNGAVSNRISALSPTEAIAVMTALAEAFESKYKDVLKALTVEARALVKTDTTGGDLPEEEVTRLVNERRNLLKIYTSIKQILELNKYDVSKFADPKKTPPIKRGKQAFSRYQYSLNGVALTAENNTLKAIGLKIGKTAKEIRDFVIKTLTTETFKWDGKNPPSTFLVIFEDNNVLSGKLMVEEDDEDDDDEDTETDSN